MLLGPLDVARDQRAQQEGRHQVHRHHALVGADRHHRPRRAVGGRGQASERATKCAQHGAVTRELVGAGRDPAEQLALVTLGQHGDLPMVAPEKARPLAVRVRPSSTEPETTRCAPGCIRLAQFVGRGAEPRAQQSRTLGRRVRPAKSRARHRARRSPPGGRSRSHPDSRSSRRCGASSRAAAGGCASRRCHSGAGPENSTTSAPAGATTRCPSATQTKSLWPSAASSCSPQSKSSARAAITPAGAIAWGRVSVAVTKIAAGLSVGEGTRANGRVRSAGQRPASSRSSRTDSASGRARARAAAANSIGAIDVSTLITTDTRERRAPR